MPLDESAPPISAEQPQPEVDDAQIIRLVLAGEVEAFSTLVDRHHARCLRTATHMLGDSDQAEDVVQDAFVRAYKYLGRYREQERFGAWLLRIVVNQCRTRATYEARFVQFDTEQYREAGSDSSHTEHDSAAAERSEELAKALAQLGPEQREAVVLRFAEELSYEEMSAVTGVRISALKMRVQRACLRLRSLLQEHLIS